MRNSPRASKPSAPSTHAHHGMPTFPRRPSDILEDLGFRDLRPIAGGSYTCRRQSSALECEAPCSVKWHCEIGILKLPYAAMRQRWYLATGAQNSVACRLLTIGQLYLSRRAGNLGCAGAVRTSHVLRQRGLRCWSSNGRETAAPTAPLPVRRPRAAPATQASPVSTRRRPKVHQNIMLPIATPQTAQAHCR